MDRVIGRDPRPAGNTKRVRELGMGHRPQAETLHDHVQQLVDPGTLAT